MAIHPKLNDKSKNYINTLQMYVFPNCNNNDYLSFLIFIFHLSILFFSAYLYHFRDFLYRGIW